MDLKLRGQLFIVCGASSGFGKAVAEALAEEGASLIAIARGEDKLKQLLAKYKGLIELLSCDITGPDAARMVLDIIGNRPLHGVLVNAAGPPAKTVLETTLQDWDDAYRSVFRWKIDLTQALLPKMKATKYGRFLYIESASVKQPMENLVLSNSMRLAVVGYVKTLSHEIARDGITMNVLAPGYHATGAMDRILKKKIEQSGITKDAAIQAFINQTSVGFLGSADDFASLAVWLLSPVSRFITGQTISVDGGTIKGVMG